MLLSPSRLRRRSATLRDIANLLHMRDPSLSSLNTLHFFRIVHFDGAQGRWVAREAGGNITRVDRKTYEAALDDVDGGADDGEQHDIYRKAVQRVRQRMPDQVDEEAALLTLEKLQWQEGDLLDCMIDTPKTARNGAGHRSDRDTRSQPGRHHNRGSRRI